MAKVKFAFTPYPLQQEVLDYMDGKITNPDGLAYRFFVLAIGRQAGKSWLAKYVLLDRAINRKEKTLWVAPSIPTARSHWDDLVSLVENSGIPTKKISQAAKQIIFADGGSISVRSAVEPDNMRGLTVDCIVMDEAAFFRGGEYVWYSIILPMVTASRGVVLFTSTPNGRNWFYQLFNQGSDPGNKLYKAWRAPSTVSPYQDPVLLAELKKTMPEYQWLEEFMAEFLADGTGVFAGAENAAVNEMLFAPEPGHSYVAGIDFGFNHDATTFTVLDKYTGKQVFGKRFYNFGTAGTIRQLVQFLRLWKPEITHLEKNGVGESLFEILKSTLLGNDDIPDILSVAVDKPTFQNGDEVDFADQHAVHEYWAEQEVEKADDKRYITEWGGKIKAIHMDNPQKRQLVEQLAADIEYQRLTTLKAIPGSYGETQLNEMSTYLRERTQSGLDITYNAAEGSFDDTISALYLANKGRKRPKPFSKALKNGGVKSNPFRGGNKHLRNRR